MYCVVEVNFQMIVERTFLKVSSLYFMSSIPFIFNFQHRISEPMAQYRLPLVVSSHLEQFLVTVSQSLLPASVLHDTYMASVNAEDES